MESGPNEQFGPDSTDFKSKYAVNSGEMMWKNGIKC